MLLMISFADFLYKIALWVFIELPRLVKAIQMRTHNILCFYKEVDKSTLVVIKRLLNCLTVSL